MGAAIGGGGQPPGLGGQPPGLGGMQARPLVAQVALRCWAPLSQRQGRRGWGWGGGVGRAAYWGGCTVLHCFA